MLNSSGSLFICSFVLSPTPPPLFLTNILGNRSFPSEKTVSQCQITTTPYKGGFTRELEDIVKYWHALRVVLNIWGAPRLVCPSHWQQGCWFAVILQSWGKGVGIGQVEMFQILFFQRFVSFSWMSVPQIVTSLLLISRVVKVFIFTVFATLFLTFWRRYVDIHTLSFQKSHTYMQHFKTMLWETLGTFLFIMISSFLILCSVLSWKIFKSWN